MRALGWVLAILAGLIIGYNVLIVPAYNEQQVEQHPWRTLLSGGNNLENAYTFTPPLTGFEVLVYAMLIGGGLMICFGDREDETKPRPAHTSNTHAADDTPHRIVTCPQCQQKLRLPTLSKALNVTCPGCRHRFTEPPAPPAASGANT